MSAKVVVMTNDREELKLDRTVAGHFVWGGTNLEVVSVNVAYRPLYIVLFMLVNLTGSAKKNDVWLAGYLLLLHPDTIKLVLEVVLRLKVSALKSYIMHYYQKHIKLTTKKKSTIKKSWEEFHQAILEEPQNLPCISPRFLASCEMYVYAPGESYPTARPVKQTRLHFSEIFLDTVGPFQPPYVQLEKTIARLTEIKALYSTVHRTFMQISIYKMTTSVLMHYKLLISDTSTHKVYRKRYRQCMAISCLKLTTACVKWCKTYYCSIYCRQRHLAAHAPWTGTTEHWQAGWGGV
jgi:hypothetical protein